MTQGQYIRDLMYCYKITNRRLASACGLCESTISTALKRNDLRIDAIIMLAAMISEISGQGTEDIMLSIMSKHNYLIAATKRDMRRFNKLVSRSK